MNAVADAKMATRSGAKITIIVIIVIIVIRTGIEIIMEIVFKLGAMLGFDMAIFKSVDGILTSLMDFMLFGSVILVLLPCHLNMTTGSF